MNTTPAIRVLIAEDDALVASLTQAELESAGFTVIGTAMDGDLAISLVAEQRPDVVVMDITMPRRDGIAAASAIQDSHPTPVVILSAHEDPALVARATAAGVGAFVVKPPQATELLRAITVARARHADLMALRRTNLELEKALAEVKTLKGIVPICCSCKKIRNDKNYWEQVEVYIMEHTDALFSHGYCPDCMEIYFPGLGGKT